MKPVAEIKTDVLVLGGGPAGIAAAIAAARIGAKTTIVESNGFLGGNLAGGLCLHTFHDANMNKIIGGFPEELIRRLIDLGGSIGPVEIKNAHMRTTTPYDHEMMKYLLFKMMDENHVDVLLHAFASDVIVSDGKIAAVSVETKSERRNYEARVYIDATGDGDIAAWSGVVPMKKGRESDGKMQAMSTVFKMACVDMDRALADIGVGKAVASVPGAGEICMWFSANLDKYRDALEAAQIFPFSHHVFWGNAFRKTDVNLNITRVIDLDPTNADELSRAEMEARYQIYKVSEFLKKNVPGFEKAYVISSVPFIGIRETRRIEGDYVLSDTDVLEGRRFPDAIARSSYPIDIHDPDGKGTSFHQVNNGFYEIPYRCLIPRGLENLLVSGRCMSTTPAALASSRTMVNVMAIGQGAGVAAGLCAVNRLDSVRSVDGKQVQKHLREQGALL